MPARSWPANRMPADCMPCVTALLLESAQSGSQGLALDEGPRDRFVKWWFDEAQNAASSGGEDGGCLRICGRPTPVQGDMQAECALVAAGHCCGDGDAYANEATLAVRNIAAQWLLLLQIGNDEKGGMGWVAEARSIFGCAGTNCAHVASIGRGWRCSVAEISMRCDCRCQRLRNSCKTGVYRFLLVGSEN